jgi:hypothetical protein
MQSKTLGIMIAPSLGAYYLVPRLGIPYVAVTTGFLVFALRYRTFSDYRWTVALWTCVTLCFVAYILWWYVTGEQWTYL